MCEHIYLLGLVDMAAVTLCDAYKSEGIAANARAAGCEKRRRWLSLRAKSLHFRRFPTSFPRPQFRPALLPARPLADRRVIDRAEILRRDAILRHAADGYPPYVYVRTRAEGHDDICILGNNRG